MTQTNEFSIGRLALQNVIDFQGFDKGLSTMTDLLIMTEEVAGDVMISL